MFANENLNIAMISNMGSILAPGCTIIVHCTLYIVQSLYILLGEREGGGRVRQ